MCIIAPHQLSLPGQMLENKCIMDIIGLYFHLFDFDNVYCNVAFHMLLLSIGYSLLYSTTTFFVLNVASLFLQIQLWVVLTAYRNVAMRNPYMSLDLTSDPSFRSNSVLIRSNSVC